MQLSQYPVEGQLGRVGCSGLYSSVPRVYLSPFILNIFSDVSPGLGHFIPGLFSASVSLQHIQYFPAINLFFSLPNPHVLLFLIHTSQNHSPWTTVSYFVLLGSRITVRSIFYIKICYEMSICIGIGFRKFGKM